VLAAPAAAIGLYLAPAASVSPVLGLVFGLMAATAIVSLAFLLWTGRALAHAASGVEKPTAAA
jgi:hypothetical protein